MTIFGQARASAQEERKGSNANREAVVLEEKKEGRQLSEYSTREEEETCPLCTFHTLYRRLTDRGFAIAVRSTLQKAPTFRSSHHLIIGDCNYESYVN